MKISRSILTIMLVLAAVLTGADHGRASSPASAQNRQALILESLDKAPLSFVENRGQMDERVKYYHKGTGREIFFTKEGIYFVFHERKDDLFRKPADAPDELGSENYVETTVVTFTPIGMQQSLEITAEDLLERKVHYYIGSDELRWRENIPTYRSITYREIVSGIDLKFYGNNRQLEYDTILKPGADLKSLTFQYGGIEKLEVTSEGDLVVRIKEGKVLLHKKPIIYQTIGGQRVERAGSFALKQFDDSSGVAGSTSAFAFGFEVPGYDPRYPLIIDPTLAYTQYLELEGTEQDYALSIAADGSGNAYITGYSWTTSPGLHSAPELLPLALTAGVYEVFVTKLNSSGADVYTTYLSGIKDSYGTAIAIDGSRNAYLTGYTLANNFPTKNSYQSTNRGESDAFVTKLTTSGALSYSTYIGGSDRDFGCGIAVDSGGRAHITGRAKSRNFPTSNAYDDAHNGDSFDVFIAKFTGAGSGLLYSTYLGGSGNEYGEDIALDSAGNGYVTGWTNSDDFPLRTPAQGTFSGVADAFVTKIAPEGNTLVYSTYLGGNDSDAAHSIVVDGDGRAYVAGETDSTNFPTRNPVQGVHAGLTDCFVTKLSDTGSSRLFSTFLGGTNTDFAYGIAVDGSGNIHLTGKTDSTNFPMQLAFSDQKGSYSAGFISKITGTTLEFSSYFVGRSGNDTSKDIAVDPSANAYIAGFTEKLGARSAFAAKIGGSAEPSVTVVFPNGGEVFSAGQARTISWTYTGNPGSTLRIDLLKGRVLQNVITSGTSAGSGGSGSYTWNIPTDQPASAQYRVKIYNPANRAYKDISDNYFTIAEPAPSADFTASPTSGAAKLDVQFQDTSTGDIRKWFWEFGDGKTSEQQNPMHTYEQPGTYDVGLAVYGPSGSDRKKQIGYIHVRLERPVANFRGSPTDGTAPLQVKFTNNSTGTFSESSWSFGDGGTSATENPTHTYSSAGTYTVRLTVSGTEGSSTKTSADYITVTPPYITVINPNGGEAWHAGSTHNIRWSYTQQAGDAVKIVLYKSGSPYRTIAESTPVGSSGEGLFEWIIPHFYTPSDRYKVKVLAVGHTSYKDFSDDYFTIFPPVNTANFTATPTEGLVPLKVDFTDASSPGVTSRLWNFGDGTTDTARNPEHTYSKPGVYTVSLRVEGEGGYDIESKEDCITVNGIKVTAPDGGELWSAGSTQTIRWRYTGNAGSNVKIELLKGNKLATTISNKTSTEDGSYRWTISANRPHGDDYRVRITSTTRPEWKDVSDQYFTIRGSAPVAAFKAVTSTTIEEGETVRFHDESTGTIDSWLWEFGDEGTSTDQNPTHRYTTPGVYTVKLTVTGPGGSDSKTRKKYITVNPHPEIVVTRPTAGAVWPAGSTQKIVWTYLGDPGSAVRIELIKGGQLDTTIAPSALIGSDGKGALSWKIPVDKTVGVDYLVRITSTTHAQYTDDSGLFSIVQPEPVANFSGTPNTGEMPLTVEFTDTSTGYITSWLWDFGDDNTTTEQNPTHVYNKAGTFTVKLSVTGPGGSSSKTREDYITVNAVPPVAQFTAAPTSGVVPLPVQFTDTSSGEVSSWSWNFGDGGVSTERNPLHTYNTAGDFTVTLTVSGNSGSDSETKSNYIHVTPPAPVAEFSGSPTQGGSPLTVNFTDQTTGTVTSWAWTFGDGGTSAQQNPSHIYATPGTYTVTLIATGPGGSSTRTRPAYITVIAPPVASFTGSPTQGLAPHTVSFTDSSTGQITGWSWSFGDGGSSTERNPSHTYTTPGTYTVALTVTGPGGSNTMTRTDYILAYVPPVAEFTGAPTEGTAPLTVNFTNSTTGTVTSWLWSFGDGGSSTEKNPSHTYIVAGTYTVTLTATGPGGTSTRTRTNFITVYAAPVAMFTGNPTSGAIPLTVNFTDTSIGIITSWLWSFGDGGSSTEKNPIHTYNAAGSYTVSLTVTGPGGVNTGTKSNYITVYAPPTANFTGSPTQGGVPLAVDFTDTSTGVVTGWSWDFGDTGTSTQQNPSHTYSAVGTYSVTLTATGPGGSDTEVKIGYITLYPPPTANFSSAPNEGGVPFTVSFTDTSTGTITGWSWTFGDGGSSAEQNPSHLYTVAGTYPVVLTVTGPGGSNTLTKPDLIIAHAPPTADFTANPVSGAASLQVQFTDASSSDVTSWLWDFGDGVGTSTLESPSYTYAVPGTYTVRLDVVGAWGTDSEVKTGYITVLEPTITVTVPNGGESWNRGTTHTITWSYSGTPGDTVRIECWKYPSGSDPFIASTPTDSTPIGQNGTGSFSWAIPSNHTYNNNSAIFKIKIISNSNSAYYDFSNAKFKIRRP